MTITSVEWDKVNKALSRNLKVFLLTAGLAVLGILVKPSVVSAALPPGIPTNVLPNNSIWEAGPRSQPANLVVALGGMDAPETDLLLYFPWHGDPNDSDQFTRLTIEGACDTNPNDVGGSRANTTYVLQNISEFNVVVGNANIFQNDGNMVVFQCNPSGGGTLVVDIKHDPNDTYIRTFDIGGVPNDFTAALMWAVAEDYVGSGDYENQFRIYGSNANVRLTYAAEDVTGSAFRTGIYNRTSDLSGCPSQSNSASCYWATSIAFAPPCNWNPSDGARIAFYDNDAQGGGYQASPNNIRWSIYRFPRDGSGGAQFVTSGNLTGGNNVQEDVGIPTDPAFSYEIRLDHIYVRNSIQVLLPWEQMYALTACSAQAQGAVDNVSCAGVWGWAFDWDKYDGNIYNRDGTFNNSTGSLTLHIYVDGTLYPVPVTANQPSNSPGDVNDTYGISGNHRFNWAIPNTYLDGANHTVVVYALGVDNNGNTDDRNPSIGSGSFTCVPPVTVSCNAINSTPTNPETGETFRISYGFKISGGAPGATYNYSVELRDITKPAGSTFTFVSPPGNPVNSGTAGAGDTNFTVANGLAPSFSANQPGDYGGTFRISGDISYDCLFGSGGVPPITVVNKPYFKVMGGDVAAGINGSCPGWSGGAGTLTAWNNGGNLTNLGAGTNLAAFALATIDQFASAQGRTSPSPPKDLSFSSNPTFGGNFQGGIACPTDYYSKGSGLPNSGSGPVDITPLNSDSKYVAPVGGRVQIIGGVVTPFERYAVFIDGDAYINAPIIINNGAGLFDQIPSFYLVVRGNIYIAPGVIQLDGVYIAQPNSDPGYMSAHGGSQGSKIYTCSNSAGDGPPSTGDLNAACRATPLTVNGAFIARELKLYRSRGSMSDTLTGPAELFNFTPATWLFAPCIISGNCSGSSPSGGYDAITSLPPVL